MPDAPKKVRNSAPSEKRQRGNRLTVRFLPDEHAELERRAADAGLSPSAYLRACALGTAGPRARRSPTVERSLAAQAIAELNKAGSNLNQIARALNMDLVVPPAEVKTASTAVKKAANQVLVAFGYKVHDRQG
jgi:hypothetical protein